MNKPYKVWTGLGLGLAIVAGVGACGKAAPPERAGAPISADTAAGTAARSFDDAIEAVASGGEGEGGISLEAAATDPVVYGAALALTEAHVIAAHDAYALGETEAAAEMFAHPVSEVLVELEDLFAANGVVPFDHLLLEASAAALAGAGTERITVLTDDIVAALRAAGEKGPQTSRGKLSVRASVAADQADRAAVMYRIAAETGAYEPYLDGYGFYKAGLALFRAAEADIAAANPAGAAALTAAFAQLAAAYPDAGRQTVLGADVSILTVAASNALLANSH